MSTWEERMAERAAARRMLREAEAYANGGAEPIGCGFEWGALGAASADDDVVTSRYYRAFPLGPPPPEQPEGIPWS